MTFTERFLVLFKKRQVVKIRRHWKDRRTTVNYAIPDKRSVITLDSRSYVINPEHVYYEKGLPTFSYNADDPTPAPVLFQFEDWKPSKITTLDFQQVIEETVTQHIIEGMEQKMSMQTLLMICTFIIVVGMGVGFYFLYDMINNIGGVRFG